MNKKMVLIPLVATVFHSAPPSDTCKQETWVTNGAVRAIVAVDDIVYIGGDFTYVGPYTGGTVPISRSTDALPERFPKFAGEVMVVIPDGNGGWYVGGQFDMVDGVARDNLAHILASGSLDRTWNPSADGTVRALAVNGTTVYAGGSFTSIGGASRNYIAALDAS